MIVNLEELNLEGGYHWLQFGDPPCGRNGGYSDLLKISGRMRLVSSYADLLGEEILNDPQF
jgi:hypothetical protein